MSQVLARELQAAFPNSGLFKNDLPDANETVAAFFDRIDFDPSAADDNVFAFVCNELYFHERGHVVESLDEAIADLQAVRQQICPGRTESRLVASGSSEIC